MSGSRPERLDVQAPQSRLPLKPPTARVSCGLLGADWGMAGDLHVPGPREKGSVQAHKHSPGQSPVSRRPCAGSPPLSRSTEGEAGSAQNTVCSKGTGKWPKRHPGPGRALGPPEDLGGARRSRHLGMGPGPGGRASPAHPRRRSPRHHPTCPACCAPKNCPSRAPGRTPGEQPGWAWR